MGCGMMTQEQVLVDEASGHLLTDGTWTYKIPTAACIPRQLNVEFLKARQPAADPACACLCVVMDGALTLQARSTSRVEHVRVSRP